MNKNPENIYDLVFGNPDDVQGRYFNALYCEEKIHLTGDVIISAMSDLTSVLAIIRDQISESIKNVNKNQN